MAAAAATIEMDMNVKDGRTAEEGKDGGESGRPGGRAGERQQHSSLLHNQRSSPLSFPVHAPNPESGNEGWADAYPRDPGFVPQTSFSTLDRVNG